MTKQVIVPDIIQIWLANCLWNSELNGRIWNARWQQTYQVNFHCLRSSEHAHITENSGFYLVSLLPPSIPKVSHSKLLFFYFPWQPGELYEHFVQHETFKGCIFFPGFYTETSSSYFYFPWQLGYAIRAFRSTWNFRGLQPPQDDPVPFQVVADLRGGVLVIIPWVPSTVPPHHCADHGLSSGVGNCTGCCTRM